MWLIVYARSGPTRYSPLGYGLFEVWGTAFVWITRRLVSEARSVNVCSHSFEKAILIFRVCGCHGDFCLP